MNSQFLKINPEKTKIIVFHPKSLINQLIIGGTCIGEDCIRFSNEVKNVGVWLDKHLNLDKHINQIVSHYYKLLRDIGRIRKLMSKKHTEMLVHAAVTSRLDYCNSLYYNMSKSNLYKLQKVQNAAARIVVRSSKRHPVSKVLKDLHWLKIEARVIFKILLLVYKCVTGQCSTNLEIKYKAHNYRPHDELSLEAKKVNTKYGKRTFNFAGPRLWNALPLDIRKETNIHKFKAQVKKLLFTNLEEFKSTLHKYD